MSRFSSRLAVHFATPLVLTAICVSILPASAADRRFDPGTFPARTGLAAGETCTIVR
jgi:hypothetical protein